MNGQEYLQTVRAQFEGDGWQVQAKQLDSDVVMLQCQQGNRTLLCMVINGEASGAHVQRLSELADDAGADGAAIAAKNGHDTAASTVIDQRGIRTVDVGAAGGTSDDDGPGKGEVSRRTAVLAVLGAGVLGAGGFLVASGGVELPALGGEEVTPITISGLAPQFEEVMLTSGTVTPSPLEEDASTIELSATLSSSFDQEVGLELVGLTFEGNGTVLSSVEVRTSETVPAGGSVTFGDTYDLEDPPNWLDVDDATMAIRVNQ